MVEFFFFFQFWILWTRNRVSFTEKCSFIYSHHKHRKTKRIVKGSEILFLFSSKKKGNQSTSGRSLLIEKDMHYLFIYYLWELYVSRSHWFPVIDNLENLKFYMWYQTMYYEIYDSPTLVVIIIESN